MVEDDLNLHPCPRPGVPVRHAHVGMIRSRRARHGEGDGAWTDARAGNLCENPRRTRPPVPPRPGPSPTSAERSVSSRCRLWRSLATGVVAVTVCAVSVAVQPLTAMAQATPATLWGIDSCETAQDVVPGTQANMGDPQFVGRYLGPSPCNPTYPELSTSEVIYLESLGVRSEE